MNIYLTHRNKFLKTDPILITGPIEYQIGTLPFIDMFLCVTDNKYLFLTANDFSSANLVFKGSTLTKALYERR